MYFMRHAKPTYEYIKKEDNITLTFLAPLMEKSRMELEEKDFSFLKDIDFIVSSNYTRALETAAIVSRKIDKKIIVETELHEWYPDKTFSKGSDYFNEANMLYVKGMPGLYETKEEMIERLEGVIKKYEGKNVLFVGHQRLFSMILNKNLDYAEIVEKV